ncbi:MAG: 30S ribosomal protein S7 [Candidatus Yanofskybacteria bacterium CG10_big_fil_rev_8_21_14_0_10_46_23]|uniref:Small ribosomal subunit protein uS7 n=1 Tax=Candidatus Yanofskybacteria bacterium CG10_big_fil_rev_8_21_14_0_10_46_23 TaxID=1975098 RepID=A0A2H0R3X0_9BACT|nr:MAG: 30S ribosomal protein S7 [Candidatus Yanofskybacteria bacterium CG10_big_fil_rev_8_21_14_0_10_46_23]
MRKPIPPKKRRRLEPDVKLESVLVSRLINYVMMGGKKSTAQRVVYDALAVAAKKSKLKDLEVLEKAIENAGPKVEIRSRRIGGANYQVPREVSNDRRVILALRWIIDAARSKKGVPISERLATELVQAANNEGAAVKKREDTHRMAEANKAFAHFAW